MNDPDPARQPQPDFAALLHRAGGGDAAALGELARRYEQKVRLVARVLLGRALRPYLDSVDLVQSVHHSVLIGLRNRRFDISDPEKLTALAVAVVRRKVARHWRRIQRQQRLSAAGGGPREVGPDMLDALSKSASGGTDPAAETAFRDQLERLRRVLSDTERRVLELRLQGHNTAEIAQHLGINPVALRVRMTRLRQRLQEHHVSADWL